MCQFCKTKKFIVLEKDLTVWKAMDSIKKEANNFILHPPYQSFSYVFGKIHTLRKKKIQKDITFGGCEKLPYEINYGFHSFLQEKDAIVFAERWGRLVVQCIAPKGSSVIYGITLMGFDTMETIVSNKIKVVKILKK